MKFYREGDLRNLIAHSINQIKGTIEEKSEDYILNVDETEFATYLSGIHQIDFPELYFDKMTVESFERDIPAEKFPPKFDTTRGEKYKRDIIVYHIPFSGNIYILQNRPISGFSISGSVEVGVNTNAITLEITDFYRSAEKIKAVFEEGKKLMLIDYHRLKKDCIEYNEGLMEVCTNLINTRKDEFLRKNNLLLSLGVPLKKNTKVSETFAVPKPKLRKRIVIEPEVSSTGYAPEPTLSTSNYVEILTIINDVGKNFERMPSTYFDKKEEDLRDHILLVLDPNFQYGSATGETFNKKGKTDILLTYNSSVVFIAECKFWSGERTYQKTIDQLLSYLTWRNSKTALVIFVRTKDISQILDKIKRATESHANYIRTEKAQDENWFNFVFHLNDDRNRLINTAVQVYHLA